MHFSQIWKKIEAFLFYSRAQGADQDATRIIQTVLLILFVGLLPLFVVNQYWKIELIYPALGFFLVLVIGAFWLTRLGHLRYTIFVIAIALTALATLMATFGQGIHDIVIVAYPGILIVSSLVISRRMLLMLIGLTVAAVGWLTFSDASGWFARETAKLGDIGDFIIVTLVIGISASWAYLLSEHNRRNLRAAQSELAERQRSEQTLRASEAELRRNSEALRASEAELRKNSEALRASEAELRKNGEALRESEVELRKNSEGLRKTAEALRLSEERYELAAQAANDGLWDMNLDTQVAYYSPRWKTILGHLEHEIGSDPGEWLNRIHPDDLAEVNAHMQAHLEGRSVSLEVEHRIQHKNGNYGWVLTRGLAQRGPDGRAHRLTGSMSDISARKLSEAQLHHNAFHDYLTGLPNRALLLERLDQTIHNQQRRPEARFAILFLDLDGFKDVNDTLGHRVGDQLLISAANRMRGILRSNDTVARLGGDEFVILLADLEKDKEAIEVAERVQTQLKQPFLLPEHDVTISASIGIVYGGAEYQQAGDMLKDADIAMYRSKALGKAQHQVFDPSMRTRIISRMKTQSDLRGALERGEFRIVYQPMVCIDNGRIVGMEALLRWQHPVLGMLLPGDFLALAEESGQIVAIERWLLDTACRQARAWNAERNGVTASGALAAPERGGVTASGALAAPERGGVTASGALAAPERGGVTASGAFNAPERGGVREPVLLSVNISSRQLARPDLVEAIAGILKVTGLDPSLLELEVTESAVMENIQQAIQTLLRLQALGVRVGLDDFGSGVSSLTYLVQLPLHLIKLERGFIAQLDEDMRRVEIVRTLANLAHTMGMLVVVEGVETSEELEWLVHTGSDYAQGYYFAGPLPAGEAGELLNDRESLKNGCN